jgi:hypothetical protein
MSVDTPLPSPGQPLGRKSPVYDANRKVTGVIFNLEGRFFEKEMLPVVVTRNNDKTVTIYCVKNVKPSVIRSFGAVCAMQILWIRPQSNPIWVTTP